MEVLVVVAIVAILATLAIPGLQNGLVRDQIVSAVPLADIAKKPVALLWTTTQTLPADNAAAGLPAAGKDREQPRSAASRCRTARFTSRSATARTR